jgi:hypothetical protein
MNDDESFDEPSVNSDDTYDMEYETTVRSQINTLQDRINALYATNRVRFPNPEFYEVMNLRTQIINLHNPPPQRPSVFTRVRRVVGSLIGGNRSATIAPR